jgi:hypothetical protein
MEDIIPKEYENLIICRFKELFNNNSLFTESIWSNAILISAGVLYEDKYIKIIVNRNPIFEVTAGFNFALGYRIEIDNKILGEYNSFIASKKIIKVWDNLKKEYENKKKEKENVIKEKKENKNKKYLYVLNSKYKGVLK